MRIIQMCFKCDSNVLKSLQNYICGMDCRTCTICQSAAA